MAKRKYGMAHFDPEEGKKGTTMSGGPVHPGNTVEDRIEAAKTPRELQAIGQPLTENEQRAFNARMKSLVEQQQRDQAL